MGAPNAAPRAAEVQNRARSRATASAASIPAGRRATTTRRGQADGRRGVCEGGDDGQQLQHPPPLPRRRRRTRARTGGRQRWPGRGRRKGKKIGIAVLCCCDSIYGFGATGDPVPGREDRSSRGRCSRDDEGGGRIETLELCYHVTK